MLYYDKMREIKYEDMKFQAMIHGAEVKDNKPPNAPSGSGAPALTDKTDVQYVEPEEFFGGGFGFGYRH